MADDLKQDLADLNAIPGEESEAKPSALPQEELDRITDALIHELKQVFDPEIPVDIYELGLIYKVDIEDDRSVKIEMTLTTPNCPSAAELPMMVENAVASVPAAWRLRIDFSRFCSRSERAVRDTMRMGQTSRFQDLASARPARYVA